MAQLRQIPLRNMAVLSFLGWALAEFFKPYPSWFRFGEILIGLYITQVVTYGFYAMFIYPWYVSPFRKLPQVAKPLPLVGNGIELRKYGPGIMGRKWFAETPNDGLMRMIWHFNQEMVLVNSPQALSEILVTKCYTFEKASFAREFLAFIIGWGLLTVEGDEHKRQRRDMLPAFSFRHIKDLYPLFWKKSCESVREITRQHCDEKGYTEMDISPWTARCALDIIGLASSGVDFGSIADENAPLAHSYSFLQPDVADLVLIGGRAFLPNWIMANLPLQRIRDGKKAVAHIRGVATELLREKQKLLDNKQDAGNDILTVAMSGRMISEETLVDQAMTFLSAGHETTASSLIWAIYYMARYPDMQEQLRKEVRDNLPSPDSDTPITSQDIDNLPFLNAVCSEVLRISSPVAQTIRVAMEDTTVQGQFIPKDTLLLLLPWTTNTDPKLWGPHAAAFKPERWLTPEQGGCSATNAASGGATSNYAFMTFLHGPHSCIGASFAKSELANLVAAWIGRFSFELKDKSLYDERNIVINPSVVAKPEGGMHMKIQALPGW